MNIKRAHSNVSFVSTFVMLLFMSGCAHNIGDTGPDLIGADKQCSALPTRTPPDFVAKLDCWDSVEIPVIKRDAPVVLPDFKILLTKRRLLAQNFLDEMAPVIEAENRFRQGDKEGATILAAHEPRWMDKDALLHKEIAVSATPQTCTSDSLLDRMKCFDAITRPIWERNAPDTIEYYNEFQENRFKFAKQYDDSGVPKITALAKEHLQKGMKEVIDEFKSDARQAIQQQQAADRENTGTESISLTDILKAIVTAGVGFGQGYAAGYGASPTDNQAQQQTFIQQQQLDLQRQQLQQQQYQAYQQQLLQNQENTNCHISRIGNPNAPCP